MAVIASGFHLFPFRTEKLSPSAPMVLQTRGRVGRRQLFKRRTCIFIIKDAGSQLFYRPFYYVTILFEIFYPLGPIRGGVILFALRIRKICLHCKQL